MWSEREPGAPRDDEHAAVLVNLVTVVYADDEDEADRYRWALERMSVPAVVGAPDDGALGIGVGGLPVCVAAELHEHASEILASFDATDPPAMEELDADSAFVVREDEECIAPDGDTEEDDEDEFDDDPDSDDEEDDLDDDDDDDLDDDDDDLDDD